MAPKRALRRPAARAPALRRPAAAVGGRAPPPDEKLIDVDFLTLGQLGTIWLTGARYYSREIDVVGFVKGSRSEAGEIYLDLEVTGTKDEEFLKSITARPDRLASVHVCKDDCDERLTGEVLLHGSRYKKVDRTKDQWYTNVEKTEVVEPGGVDEMAALRLAAEGRGDKGDEGTPKEKKEKKDKKSKKEKKERKQREAKKKSIYDESSDDEYKARGKKDPEALFCGTAMDPDRARRKRQLRKAQKMGQNLKKKKKKKSSNSGESSTSGSSSSGSLDDTTFSLFESEGKVRKIAEKVPGALTYSSLQEARQSLLTSAGTSWALERGSTSPVFVQYTRMNMAAGMSPAMLQEALTISTALDALILGRVAFTTDILSQRLKALEALSRGSHWSVARQLEVIRADSQSLAQGSEALDAARRAREEEKLRQLVARAPAQRGGEKDPGYQGGKTGKGNWKGGNKNKSNDGQRGKYNDGKKDDKNPRWQDQKQK